MRLIPKDTKIRTQFYKNITLSDLILGFIILLVIALILSSNLPNKYFAALIVLGLTLPLFISMGDEKIYSFLFYLFKYAFSKKLYVPTNELFPYFTIESDCIKNLDGSFVGIIEIMPINFQLFSQERQNMIINNFALALDSLSTTQQASIIKLDKPLDLTPFINCEVDRLKNIIYNKEKRLLSTNEYSARIDILEDRLTLMDNLNSCGNVKQNAFYFVLYDSNKESLLHSLSYIKQLLSPNARQLNSVELEDFISLFNNEAEKKLPNKMEFGLLKTRQDNIDMSHFVISDYPLQVANGWGAELFTMPNTKIVMRLQTVEKEKAIRRIDNAILELSTRNANKTSHVVERNTHFETLSNLLLSLKNDNETLCDTTIIITAYDEKGSTVNRKAVKNKCRELGLVYNEMFARQQDTFLSSSLSTYDKINISRGMPSSTVAACFPFISESILDNNGVLIGENELPVLLDLFKRDLTYLNSNMVIVGNSGSGKSYAVKNLLANLSTLDTKIFVLDPEGEYYKLAKNLGGRVLDAASAKFGKLNPFHIVKTLDDKNKDRSQNSFYAHLQFLEEFFKQVLQGINTDCFELLNKLIIEVYAHKGITPTSRHKSSVKAYPTFDDLDRLIEDKLTRQIDEQSLACLKTLQVHISKFANGGRYSALWNGPSSLKAKENFVAFNFQRLLVNKNSIVANAQMLLILRWLENEIIRNRDYNLKHGATRKIIIVIDEAHIFIDEKYPIALDFMYQLAKRIRKYDGMQIVVTQNIKDFTNTEEIAKKSMAIINVSQYSLIFSLSPNDITDLCVLYQNAGQINQTEIESILYNPRGSAFLISSPHSRTNLKFVATPYVANLFCEK